MSDSPSDGIPPPVTVFPEEKRSAKRTPMRETVTMELENGQVILGVTRDISINGAFVETSLPAPTLHEGDRGVLAMAAMDDIIAIFCQVSRITNQGVGLLLLDGPDDALSRLFSGFSINNEMCLRVAPPQDLPVNRLP